MDKINSLATERIGKLLLKYSIPAIVAMLVMASYNVVDRIFVGRGVGALAISGITITFPLILLQLGFGMLIAIGSTALVSIRLGEKKSEEAEKILGNSITLSIIVGLLLFIPGIIFMDDLLYMFGARGEVLVYAKDFMSILIFGVVFTSITFSLNNIIRGQGKPNMAMITIVSTAVLNVILNPIFIFGLHMGVKGSALATVIAQFYGMCLVLWFYLSKRSSIKLHLKNLILKKEIVSKILMIGASSFVMQLAGSAVTIIFNKELSHFGGDIAIAALGIGNSIVMFFFMPIIGLVQGMQPIIGYNYGAKQFDRVKKTLKIAITYATSICILGFVLVMFFTSSLIGLFCNNNPELIQIGTHGIRILLIMFPVLGFWVISSSYFQAVGKGKYSLVLTLSRQVILLIPLLLILPKFYNIDGIWMAQPVSDFLAAIISGIFLFAELKKLDRKHALATETI
jgi:putative MATE family efflux protein